MERLCSKYLFPSNSATGSLGSIDLNLHLMQWFGLPLFGAKHEFNTPVLVYGIIILGFFRIPYHSFQIYDAILCWGNFDDFIQNICMTMLQLGASLKTIIVFGRLGDVHRIVWQFRFMAEKYVKSEKQKAIFQKLEFENKMSFVVYVCMVGSSSICGMIMLFLDPITFVGQMFPYRAKMPDVIPFKVQMFYMPVALLFIGFQVVGIDFLNVTFINLTRCQLEILNISFDELNESMVERITVDPVNHFNGIVEHHTDILSIREQIENVFRFPMLVQFVFSLFIYALTGFQALVRSDTSGLVMIYFFVGCILAQLLVYCWFGNEVSEQNKTLALRGYDTSWYNFDVKFRKSLVIILMNAQKPLSFTAGGYVELSLMTFSRILSKSYTFVAVLRQQYSGE